MSQSAKKTVVIGSILQTEIATVQMQLPTGLKVLLIEDEAVIAMLLAEVLADLGHQVGEAEATEAGAIAQAARDRPDLIIADARLRVGSGIAAVEQIIRQHFIPHIFVSGYRLDKAVLHPRCVLLQKPYFDRDLERAINEAIRL